MLTKTNERMMEREHLQSFEAFARHLSFTAAARELHVSQPALFVQVKKLSAAVGVCLYERRGRTLALTPAGERLALHARRTLEADASLLAELRGENLRSPLTLACGEGAFLHLVGPSLPVDAGRARVGPASPSPALRVAIHDRDATLAAVRSGEAHIGVTVSSEDLVDLRCEVLWSGFPHVLLPRTHRLARAKTVKLVDLSGEPLVVAPEGTPTRAALVSALDAVGARLQLGLEASGWEAQRYAVRWGLGVALVSGICPPLPGTVAVPLASPTRSGISAARYVLLRRREPSTRDDLETFAAALIAGIRARRRSKM